MRSEIKRRYYETRGQPFDGRFYPWDYVFYNRQLTTKEYSIDMKKVGEYFEVSTTVQRMLSTFESLFGLRLQEIESKEFAWDESVKVYSAWDEDDLGGGFLGYLYIDLFGREDKDDANCSRTLEPVSLGSHIFWIRVLTTTQREGTHTRRWYTSLSQYNSVLFVFQADLQQTMSVTAIQLRDAVPRVSDETEDLVDFLNMLIAIQRLGHAIHDLVSKPKYSRFHGTSVAVDFGEAPSQMLENWCWDPAFLTGLSQHYSYTSPEHLALWKQSSQYDQPPEQIPNDMVAGVVGSKYCGKPSFLLGQVLFAMFDIRIHLEDEGAIRKLGLTKDYNDMIEGIQMFDVSPDRVDWSSPFVLSSHLMEEYNAGYYSYLL